MNTARSNRREFLIARKRIDVSVGESVRIVREFQGLTQSRLSTLTGIPQSTMSSIEHDRIGLGVERAKVLARALKCHPAVLVFPGWVWFVSQQLREGGWSTRTSSPIGLGDKFIEPSAGASVQSSP